ncbi:hypothetical protein LEP1GSC008_2285 [Leptospira kirschneri serovar Bulgarica str. Nikolaevo]|uniref:Uncharacterized protein n=1 Tax=Leptospira kirschneri serovar Bulgarica str. Nikolaevo TaxID=1240687 RepID=M6F3L0_9LEPT|nr:hypothetical protein LEP1GSC008_2285 [Leptospira kirschneri serovar Bulgarica str. Nikolaevo]
MKKFKTTQSKIRSSKSNIKSFFLRIYPKPVRKNAVVPTSFHFNFTV